MANVNEVMAGNIQGSEKEGKWRGKENILGQMEGSM